MDFLHRIKRRIVETRKARALDENETRRVMEKDLRNFISNIRADGYLKNCVVELTWEKRTPAASGVVVSPDASEVISFAFMYQMVLLGAGPRGAEWWRDNSFHWDGYDYPIEYEELIEEMGLIIRNAIDFGIYSVGPDSRSKHRVSIVAESDAERREIQESSRDRSVRAVISPEAWASSRE